MNCFVDNSRSLHKKLLTYSFSGLPEKKIVLTLLQYGILVYSRGGQPFLKLGQTLQTFSLSGQKVIRKMNSIVVIK